MMISTAGSKKNSRDRISKLSLYTLGEKIGCLVNSKFVINIEEYFYC